MNFAHTRKNVVCVQITKMQQRKIANVWVYLNFGQTTHVQAMCVQLKNEMCLREAKNPSQLTL